MALPREQLGNRRHTLDLEQPEHTLDVGADPPGRETDGAPGSRSSRRPRTLADALNQAARELLLLQSSDWPFLVTTGQARAYAIERFQSHVDRFNELADWIEAGDAGGAAALAETLWERDKVFPTIDYRWFAERQGRAD